MQYQSPSFNIYSCDSLADIASKVCHEFQNLDLNQSESAVAGDDDFEFALPAASGDDIFLNGTAQIRPVFPVFNRDLLGIRTDGDSGDRLGFGGGDCDFGDRLGFCGGEDDEASDPPSSCSSEADELEGIPEGTYCVWKPANAPATPSPSASPEFRRKSRSTGSTSSKRWRFRDLLRRSNSDGKDSFVFLTPPSGGAKKIAGEDPKPEVKSSAAKIRATGPHPTARIGAPAKGKTVAAAHEVFYVRNREINRTAERRRSTSLPYKNGWFGFSASVSTMGRTFPPF